MQWILFAIIVDIFVTIFALASGVSAFIAIPLGIIGLVAFPAVIFGIILMVGITMQGRRTGRGDRF